jgi:hypothetical protein
MLRFILKICQIYVILKYFKTIVQVLNLLVKNIGYNILKAFLNIFYSLN